MSMVYDMIVVDLHWSRHVKQLRPKSTESSLLILYRRLDQEYIPPSVETVCCCAAIGASADGLS